MDSCSNSAIDATTDESFRNTISKALCKPTGSCFYSTFNCSHVGLIQFEKTLFNTFYSALRCSHLSNSLGTKNSELLFFIRHNFNDDESYEGII